MMIMDYLTIQWTLQAGRRGEPGDFGWRRARPAFSRTRLL